MTEESNKPAPIIIKKINHGHHGHHGGAWKVAYADFVTAMMAFFLLMWLLNSVPSEKLKGIAQYFEPTIGISGAKGIGFEGGLTSTPNESGTRSADMTKGIKYGVISKGEIVATKKAGTEVTLEERDNERFTLIEGELKKVVANDSQLGEMADSISFQMTPEGLNILISDQDKYPMFKPGSDDINTYTKNLLFKIAKLLQFSPNFIAISGYTDKALSKTDQAEYTNWELSADRANAARRYLIKSGLPQDQIARIVGKADTEPLDTNNPYSAKNRRIAITLLRNSVLPYTKLSAPKNIIGSQENKLY